MRKRVCAGSLVALVAFLASTVAAWAQQRNVVVAVPPEIQRAQGFDPAHSAGLFVGISEFEKDPDLAAVPYAVDDAVDLAYLFALELNLLPPERVVLSLSGEPRKAVSQQRLAALLTAKAVRESAVKADILRLLDQQRRASGPQGLFIATFATHGFSDEGADFLLAADTLRRFIKDTGVPLATAFDVISEANAPRRLVLLDACREKFRRGQRGSPRVAMSETFAEAIAGAEGMVVISGTTLGGYAYDDEARKNGVFTAAVLDGIRGAAPADERGFITVRALADEVNRQVIAWVKNHRPEDAALSKGISRRLEGDVAQMPLAVDSVHFTALADYRQRRAAALAKLRGQLDLPLTGALYDEMKAYLSPDAPSTERLALLGEIEALDGTVRMRRSLMFYWREHRGSSPSSTAGDRRAVSSPPKLWRDPILNVEFVYLEPGTFWMGSPAGEAGRDEDERRHQVTLTKGFYMARTEVTQGQFAEFVKERTYVTDAEKGGGSWVWNGEKWEKREGVSWRDSGGIDYPVAHVSWNDVKAFTAWLSERSGQNIGLPTEAQWEYAARAGTPTATYAGDLQNLECEDQKLDEIACYCGSSKGKACPVGTKKENSWGLYDILGNLWEWTEDSGDWDDEKKQVVTDTYKEDFVKDPVSERGPSRVLRGGGWNNHARYCRAANRIASSPGNRDAGIGFRLVRTLP